MIYVEGGEHDFFQRIFRGRGLWKISTNVTEGIRGDS